MIDPLPEDKAERKFWEKSVKVLGDGDRLKHMALNLAIMYHVSPNEKLKRTYATLHNDVLKLMKERGSWPKT